MRKKKTDIIIYEDSVETSVINIKKEKSEKLVVDIPNDQLKYTQLNLKNIENKNMITNEGQFLELLYSLDDKRNIERLIKMRLLLGYGIPCYKILERNGNTENTIKKLNVEFIIKQNDGSTTNNRYTIDILFLLYSNSDKDFSHICNHQSEYTNRYKKPIDNNIYLCQKTGTIYFKIKESYSTYVLGTSTAKKVFFYIIKKADIKKIIDYIVEDTYEKNLEDVELKKYFVDIY